MHHRQLYEVEKPSTSAILAFFPPKKLNCVKMKRTKQEYCRMAYEVRTMTFQDSVEDIAKTQNDTPGRWLLKRLSGFVDLVAEEAVYHKDCFTFFFFTLRKFWFKAR
jgi:hypothetical protein